MQTEKTSARNSILAFLGQYNKIVIWLLIYLTMVLLLVRTFGWAEAFRNATATILPMLVCWAILNYLLLPRMLHRSKVGFFLLTLLMLLVLMPLGSRFDVYIHQHFSSPNDVPLPEAERIPYYLLHIKYSILLILTTAATAINFLIDERKRQAAMFREQQMQEQLKYLRAQINPHFLFNALNCIYALTMMKDEQAKEVKYIQNYIDFQRIRMEREPDLTLDVQISDPAYTIPPMLLQPIIENCFKHSRLIDDPKAWVRISIRQNDSGLLFISDNSKPSATNFSRQSAIIGRQDEERTGIGLMNVQQRLAVLFGDKCSLKVIEDNSHYKTVLHI